MAKAMRKARRLLGIYGDFNMAAMEVNLEYINGEISREDMIMFMDALNIITRKQRF